MEYGVNFWKIQLEDADEGVGWQHWQYDVEESDDCCRGRACWSKGELIGEEEALGAIKNWQCISQIVKVPEWWK